MKFTKDEKIRLVLGIGVILIVLLTAKIAVEMSVYNHLMDTNKRLSRLEIHVSEIEYSQSVQQGVEKATEEPVQQIELNRTDDNRYVMAKSIVGTNKISIEDYEIMCRVTLNTAGNDYEQQVKVASTIINRLNDEGYPDTIQEIIQQPYQYKHDGSSEITDDVRKAVKEVLQKVEYQEFFY